MKHRSAFVLLLALPLWPVLASAQEYEEIGTMRRVEGGRQLIPMRDIFEALDWTVEWAPLSRTITATLDDRFRMTMQIDNHLALVNGEQFNLDVPPRLIVDTTFVPLRFVAEVTGCQVDYLGDRVQVTDEDGSVLIVHLWDPDE